VRLPKYLNKLSIGKRKAVGLKEFQANRLLVKPKGQPRRVYRQAWFDEGIEPDKWTFGLEPVENPSGLWLAQGLML
jgi:hypothetical protein